MKLAILLLIPFYIFYIVCLGVVMFKKRINAIKGKEISAQYFKDYQGVVPAQLKVYQNHFENQFQFPVVFFITCLALIQTQATTMVTVLLSYCFVLTRLFHSYFHLGSNNLRLRGLSYLTGVFIILALWINIVIAYL